MRELALGQQRQRREGGGERGVARDGAPADGRAGAEAGARRAGTAAQDRADHRRGEDRHQRRGEQRGRLGAGDHPGGERELGHDQQRPGDGLGARVCDPERGQRGAARRRARELRETRRRQHSPEDQSPRHLEHDRQPSKRGRPVTGRPRSRCGLGARPRGAAPGLLLDLHLVAVGCDDVLLVDRGLVVAEAALDLVLLPSAALTLSLPPPARMLSLPVPP